MSRSRRSSPAGGMTSAPSDKPGKVIGHRGERRAVRIALQRGDESLPARGSLDNPASYPKDGKAWYGTGRPRLLRK
jgi:hypothetical protein